MSIDFSGIESLIIDQLWQVTAVILVIGLLTHFFFRRHSHLAYAMWLVILLKCIMPPIWSSPTGVFSWIGAETATIRSTETSRVLPAGNTALTSSLPALSVNFDDIAEPSQFTSAPPARTITVRQVLCLVWFCGAAALAGVLMGRRSYYSILLRYNLVKTEDGVIRLVEGLSRRLGLRHSVEVLVTSQPFGPAVYGLRRATLILPEMLLKNEITPQIERIVAHELVHIRRRDNIVGELQLLAQIIWWFHPLVWWTNRRICREREFCCDEEVVANLNCNPGNYAQDLLDVLKLRRQLRPALLPGMDANEVTTLRLEKIMDNRKTFHRRMPGIGWAMLVAGILLIMPGAGLSFLGLDAVSQNTVEGAVPDKEGGEAALTLTAEETAKPAQTNAEAAPGAPPKIVKTSPKIGDTEVDPTLTEISVTFDQDMGEGMSWTGGGPELPPVKPGTNPSWRDKRTCVLPVKLSAGKYYRVGINSQSFKNFQSASGIPADQTAIYFTTKGAGQELKNKVKKPEIVSMSPANGAKDVDPKIKELRVTFNVPMDAGFSWTGGGEHYPKNPEGKGPFWTKDHKTCILPVELQPDWEYRLGLNSLSFKNFQSAGGIPLEPVEYSFKTKK